MFFMVDASFTQFLERAQDPATPAEELARLVELTLKEYQESSRRGYFNRLQDEGSENHARASRVLQALASNPNCDNETLQTLCCFATESVIHSPILSLLALEDPEFTTWNQVPLQHLRIVAHGQGHPLYPILARICRPSWRYKHRDGAKTTYVTNCNDHFCAVCFPDEAEAHLQEWQRRK